MLQFFFNPWMLLGIAGVILPVIAHLLSRRKYDVVQWGAMQFLNPSRRTRRKMRLEELLLLLLRMLMVALIALAAARPLINSGFLTGYNSAGSRDVVLVIDGSNSMARSDGLTSLHQRAIRRASEFLDTLQPGDTVAVIDARDRPIKEVQSPLQDHELVREKLEGIPPPAGAADLRRACEEAVGILGRSSNGAREIVVFTDRQRAGWAPANDALWARFDEVLKFPSVQPKVWVTDVSSGMGAIRRNISVGRVDVSRDLTVPGFPLNLQVPVRNAGDTDMNVPVQVLINGQRVANLDSSVNVPADSETTFNQSIRFNMEGTNLVTVEVNLPNDSIKADNQSHAAVQVTSAIPVLLIETSRSLRKSEWNTFFASIALTAAENESPWIVARTVSASEVSPDDLRDVAAVVLPDVQSLPEGMPQALFDFAHRGKGVFSALGPQTTEASFQQLYADSGLFSGIALKRLRSADPDAAIPTTVAPYSLESGWLERFRERKGASLLVAEFNRWWQVKILPPNKSPRIAGSGAADTSGVQGIEESVRPPATVAQLTAGDPLLLQAKCGRGTVLLMTSTLNTAWNALPTTPDYVPFLHEALFQMAASQVQRNVGFGQPLQAILPGKLDEARRQRLHFSGPFDRSDEANFLQGETESSATLSATRIPGVYRLSNRELPDEAPLDQFVVNYDHVEDDPAELEASDRARLAQNDRMIFVDSSEKLRQQMYGDESRSELWAILLWLFLGLLLLEICVTRRLVMRGHADTEPLK